MFPDPFLPRVAVRVGKGSGYARLGWSREGCATESAVLPGNPCGVPPGSVVQLLTSEFQRGWIRVSSVWMDSA